MKKFLTLIMVCLISASVNFVYAKQSTDQENLNTQLLEASKKGNLEEVKKLIAQGADVNLQNKYGNTAISIIPKGERPEIVELLKAAGAKE